MANEILFTLTPNISSSAYFFVATLIALGYK